MKVFSRNGPKRESWNTINLGTKYANAVLGGLEWLGFGVQVTTADLFRFVEFRATALISPNLYRRFEGEAYFPEVFDKNTHADVWFDYLRRTKDNFFGIGPRIPNTSQTNFDLEERSYNATLYHDFARAYRSVGILGYPIRRPTRGKKIETFRSTASSPATRIRFPSQIWLQGYLLTPRFSPMEASPNTICEMTRTG